MTRPKTAFVLGAGLGTRLRPLTLNTPKPMLCIKGRPLIERIFDKILDSSINDILINTHHAPQVYCDHFKGEFYKAARLKFIHEETLLDTGGALKNALEFIDTESGILVYNGDILSGANIAKFLDFFENSTESVALMLRDSGANKNVAVKDGHVCDMRFLLKNDFEKTAQFTGIFAARGEFFKFLKEEPRAIFSTVDIFLKMIQKSPLSIAAYFDNSDWNDIGTLAEYERLK